MSDRRETRFRMDLRTGKISEIVDPDATGVGLAAAADEDDWRLIGEIDPTTGRARVDYSVARRWRPLSEFLRWR